MACNCITDKHKMLCELCYKYFCENCIYLTCYICHKQFTCFGCGSQERAKYFMGLPCAVRCENSCIHCCKKHIKCTIDDKQICEQDNCKICKFNKEYEEKYGEK